MLHTRPYRESSLLIDVFCEGHGRFMLNAKGARRQKSGMRGVLMPFRPLLLSWTGRGQLPVLTGAESRGYLASLSGDALHSACYVNELVLKLLHRFDEHDALFAAYEQAIRALVKTDDIAESLRLFEKKLLDETGFGLVLDHDADTGEEIDPLCQYRYVPEHGPVRESSATRPGIRISGKALVSLRGEGRPRDESRNEIRNLHRSLIMSQLGGRQMRSRNVLTQVHRHLGRPGIAPSSADS